MNKLIVCLTLLVSGVGHAQISVEEKAQQVANEVARDARYLPQQQREKIAYHLNQIRSILNGSEQPNPGPGRTQFTCVAKDNDGRAPWALAIRRGIDVTRIQNAIFNSIPECEDAIKSARSIQGVDLICSSKDNDGRAPYDMGILGDGARLIKIQKSAVSTMASCQQSMRDMSVYRDQALFCGSRDNDGRAPFQALSLSLRSGETRSGTETFNNMNDCLNFVRQR